MSIEAPANSLSFFLSFASATNRPLALKNPNRKKRTVKEVIERKKAKIPYPSEPKVLVVIMLVDNASKKA